MKRLLLLALLAMPAWPYACTVSASYTLTASAGHWTGTGCTGGSFIPGAGDTVTIAGSTTLLTVNQDWTIGASGANNTTPAILIPTGGSGGGTRVEVGSGVTLTARGDVIGPATCASNVDFIIMDAGSTFKFDSSLSSSPTTTRYRVGNPSTGCGYFVANGTSASRVTVTSVLTNGALPGQFRSGDSVIGAAPTYYMPVRAAYTDFSYIGDGSTYGEAFAIWQHTGAGGTEGFTYCTFNFVGPWWNPGATGAVTVSTGETFLVDHNSWTNSFGKNNILVVSEAPTSGGTQVVTNNYFDLGWNSPQGWPNCNGGTLHPGLTVTGNVFARGYCGPANWDSAGETPFSNNIIGSTCSTEEALPGASPANIYFWCFWDQDNPHISQPQQWNQTLTYVVFDSMGPTLTDDGSAFHGGGSTGEIATLLNSVVLPARDGSGAVNISDHGNGGIANIQVFTHNAGAPSVGLTVDESGAGNNTVAAYKDNAFAYPSAQNAIKNECGGSYKNDLCTSSTACDYNSIYPLSMSSACAPTGAQNGYETQMDYSPNYTGTHDVSTANVPTFSGPYFADKARRLATADTLLFHNSASRGPWAAAAVYAVADSALVNHSASVYYGSPVNYYCIKAHTATANNEPEEGSYTSANGGVVSFAVSGNVATAVLGESSQLSVGSLIHIRGTFSGARIDANPAVTGVSTTTVANDTITFALTLGNGTYTSSAILTTWMAFWQHKTLTTLAGYLATGKTFIDGAVPGCQTTACGPVAYLINWTLRGYTPQNPALWCAGHDGEAIGAVPFCAAGKLMLGAM